MNIKQTSASDLKSVNFQAKTVINAPDEMLSKEDKAYFQNLGRKLGTNRDTIEITIGKIKPDLFDENTEQYLFMQEVSIKDNNSAVDTKSAEFVPYIKNGEKNEQISPKICMEKAFEHITKMFRQ